MICRKCGAQVNEGYRFCTACGAEQIPVNEQVAVFAQPVKPAIQLPTDRGLVKMIFLSLLTGGIYGMVIWCKMVTEINITASRYDGKRTCPYFATLLLTMVTFGIYAFVWQHKFTDRVGNELRRRGVKSDFSSSDFWLWCVLGSLIGVGPYIYTYKLLKSMNQINSHFNEVG